MKNSMTDFDDCTLQDEDEHYNDMLAGNLALENRLTAISRSQRHQGSESCRIGEGLNAFVGTYTFGPPKTRWQGVEDRVLGHMMMVTAVSDPAASVGRKRCSVR